MAKKYNRSRPQKKNVSRQKDESFQVEAGQELGVESPKKQSGKKSSSDINVNRYRNPLT